MKRSKHSLSHYKLATFKMGQLIPVSCVEVLPGDTLQQATSALMRVSPLLAPVMHPVSVRIHHWYVPHRLVWDGWEDFITGGPDGEGGAAGPYPTIDPGAGGFAAKSLADYFGIPPLVAGVVSALPFRSFNLIFNEFYRDQDTLAPLAEDNTDVPLVAWEKDYFTSARPWPQKGPDVTLPLGTGAPVVGVGAPTFDVPGQAGTNLTSQAGTREAWWNGNATGNAAATWADPKLMADLSAATAVDVNTVRRAFAIQRYQEARAQYGSRYTEYLRYLGVRSSDARLQRPEYLGGGKQTVSFSEVLQTGPDTADEGVANLKGHGIAAMRSRRYRRFFEEHGLVISLMSVRPRSMYANNLSKMWLRRTKEEYWQKELEQIGQQEVSHREIYSAAATPDETFGWQDRYAEYRHTQSTIAGDFRTTLNYWHLARIFASQPLLNSDFILCDPSTRIHAVTSEDTLWCMVSNSIQARRMVGKQTIGRIL